MSSNELETDEAAEARIKERVNSAPDQPDMPAEVVVQKKQPCAACSQSAADWQEWSNGLRRRMWQEGTESIGGMPEV